MNRIALVKAAVTLLVVFHHTAISYGAIGGWFYVERPPDGSWSSWALVVFCTLNQAWFMGLFFLLAGRFTPGSIERKGPGAFLRDRLLRLGLPWLVFGVVLGPVTIAMAQTARGRDFGDVLLRLWQSGTFEPGPLWFAQALLVFSVVAVLARGPLRSAAARPLPFPSDRTLLLAALVVGAAGFLLRLVWPVGSTFAFLQLGYFPAYVLLFATGCIAAGQGWFEQVPRERLQRWRRVTRWTIPALLPLAVLGDVFPALRAPATGGWNLPAAMYAFWEPFVAWGLLLRLVAWGADPAARPASSRPWRWLPPAPWPRLSQRAYAIYVIHPPIVVGVALAWRDVAAPALLKFAVTGTLACAVCYGAAGLLLRLPPVRRVLG